jgi:carboxymethylenebutenolidase
MRRSIVPLLLSAFALFACAADQPATTASAPAEPDHSAMHSSAPPASTAGAAAPAISFPSSSGNASGYLAAPQGSSGRKPAVIVIQEWWGLNDWVRQQTDRFAGQGYVALAVDLYRGRVATTMEEAHELSRGLPEDRAVADLKAAVDYLSSRPDVDPKRIGVIGWCLGGGYSLALTTNDPRIAACVINYGRLVTDHATIARIPAPILGNFGAADRGIPPADVKAFGAALTAAGKLGDIKIYEGAGHGFMNPNNKEGYNAAAAEDAWRRIDGFFARTLRVNMPNS